MDRRDACPTSSLLLILVHHLEIGVHDVAFFAGGLRWFRSRFGLGSRPTRGSTRGGLRLRINVRRDRVAYFGQLLLGGLHRVEVFRLERVFDLRQRVFEFLALLVADDVFVLLHQLLGLVHTRIRAVLQLDRLTKFLVFLSVRFRFFPHLLNLFLREA